MFGDKNKNFSGLHTACALNYAAGVSLTHTAELASFYRTCMPGMEFLLLKQLQKSSVRDP